MTSSGRRQLSGRVEMDETYIGGNGKPGVTGRGAAGKTVVAGAIERVGRGFGRARLQVIPDVSSASLAAFLRTHLSRARRSSRTRGPPIRPRSPRQESHTRRTMWRRLTSPRMCPCRACTACSLSLTKRVLDGTHQGSVQPEHLQAYLGEFVFRFNRRTSHKRGMLFFRLLEAAVAGSPAPYKDIAVIHRKPLIVPIPPPAPRNLPRTLAGLPLERPWRAA